MFQPPRRALIIFGLLFLSSTFIVRHRVGATHNGAQPPAAAARARTLPSPSRYGQLPLSFEANQGQTDGQVKFIARGSGFNLFLTATEAVIVTPAPVRDAGTDASLKQNVLRMNLRHSNPAPAITGEDATAGTSNYLTGRDPARWQLNVPHYGRVRYAQIYPGIDLTYQACGQQLEYDFQVAAGSDPAQIQLSFTGARKLSVGAGALLIETRAGLVKQARPFIYQDVAGHRRAVRGRYVVRGSNEVGFAVGAYDRTRPLVIDPVISYSTYLGGSGDDVARSIAVDDAGNAYVCGTTSSLNFPTTAGAFQPTFIGGNPQQDAFVTKLNADGSALVYSTYLGGDGFDDAYAIKVDAAGNAYVAGRTGAPNFPVTPGAYATNGSIFVTKLNPAGSTLLYSTYLGNAVGISFNINYDVGLLGLAIDGSGNAYVAAAGGTITKLNANGSAALYTAHVNAHPTAIAVDAANNAYVTGWIDASCCTNSFAPTPNAYQQTKGGNFTYDAFVLKLNSDGSAPVYATYLGGFHNFANGGTDRPGDDIGIGIGVDSAGNAYVSGMTRSNCFPTSNPYVVPTGSACANGNNPTKPFAVKLNTDGSQLLFAKVLANIFTNTEGGIAVTPSGDNFTTQNDVANVYIEKRDAVGQTIYTTSLGGAGGDTPRGIAIDSAGNVYIAGNTSSTDYPTTANAFQRNLNVGSGSCLNCGDAFITKLLAAHRIFGRITDGSGHALSGVTVQLSGAQIATAQTDANGDYTLNDLQAGQSYTVTPVKANYHFTPASLAVNNLTADQTANFTGTFNTYTLNGHVTDSMGNGLSGVQIILSGDQSGTSLTGASGDYSFPGLVATGNYTVTPAKTGFIFTPASASFNNLSGDQVSDFVATPIYTITGSVTRNGVGILGVMVALNGTETGLTTTDSSGNYSFQNVVPGSYTVTPSLAGYKFTPASQAFTNLSSNQIANFTGLRLFTISGQVTKDAAGFGGVTVMLSGSTVSTATTDDSGSYSFTDLEESGNYTVTPAQANYTFTPSSLSFNSLSANQTANFTGALNTYTVSGRVRDAQGHGVAGVLIHLSGGLTGDTTTDTNGNYAFAGVSHGGNYVIILSKSGFAFSPASMQFSNLSGNVTADFVALAIVQFTAGAITFDEGAGNAALGITRTGDLSGSSVISYRTVDNPAAVRCDDTTTMPGVAFARCDYATTNDILTFAPGETNKIIKVPLIDDAHVEPDETLQIMLVSTGTGTALGLPASVTVTLRDNDRPGAANPIFTTPFFVRMQYLDFLAREPESGEPWSGILNNCPDANNVDPNSPSASCDRITVSAAFFGSPEFRLKGFYVFLFYRVAFNRLAEYTEIIPDIRSVTGATAQEVFQKKAAFANAFTQRTEFTTLYPTGLSNSAYVTNLLQRYNLTQITTPDPANPDGTTKVTLTNSDLTSRLDAGTLTRAQVLRAIVDSDQIGAAEFNRAFVAMQYYGYLRRTPETSGYNAWLAYLTTHPDDFRTMVNGFLNSQEYKLRFGQP
ncbi:MAG: carboxypeptidase regulatory-like domain-containing protein [Pyrinomonadaceae bacterium]